MIAPATYPGNTGIAPAIPTSRQAREAAQRARMAERFKDRKPTPATADFDLPAGQDARETP